MGLLKETLQAIIRIDQNLNQLCKPVMVADVKKLTKTDEALYKREFLGEWIEKHSFDYPCHLTFGGRLRAIRNYLGATQKAFAEDIGVTFGHISNLEKDISDPSAMFIRAVSRRWSIDERWLATGQLPQTTEEPATPIAIGKLVPLNGYDEG